MNATTKMEMCVLFRAYTGTPVHLHSDSRDSRIIHFDAIEATMHAMSIVGFSS